MSKDNGPMKRKPSCCSVIAEVRQEAELKRENRVEPQPWIVLKFTVGLAVGIIGYASYVYVGRLCLPMIQGKSGAFGDRTMGVTFLVVFSILLFMMVWAFVKAVFTPPGQAKDYTDRCAQPTYQPRDPSVQPFHSHDTDGTSIENISPSSDTSPPSPKHNKTPSEKSPRHSRSTPSHGPTRMETQHTLNKSQMTDNNAGVLDALPNPIRPPRPPNMTSPLHNRSGDLPELPPPLFSRSPPTTPVLLPEYRYCYRDQIIKPYRAHHCRACGTCILKYDHHCPWIGQCVGARNHKFFVHFLQWASIFCIWTFATLLALIVRARAGPDFDVDPQKIIVIALAALFGLFTTLLLGSHVRLITSNQSTVESLGSHAMRDRELATLRQMYSWHEFGAKRRKRNEWDMEWGRIGKEGNLWWLGSSRANWESVMGRTVWSWILPIGRSPHDGLNYPINPRFDAEGRWRRRKQWPSGLQ